MSDAGARLRQRFGGLTNRFVVPEWKGVIPDDSQGEPAVYASPFTLADTASVQKYIDTEAPEGWAHVVLRKARTEDGERMFDIGDRKILLECCEAQTLSDLATRIMETIAPGEAVGNSEGGQT